MELIVTKLALGRESLSSINYTNSGQKIFSFNTKIRKCDILLPSASQKVLVFFVRSTNLQNLFLVHVYFYNKTPKKCNFCGTFSHLDGTELDMSNGL